MKKVFLIVLFLFVIIAVCKEIYNYSELYKNISELVTNGEIEYMKGNKDSVYFYNALNLISNNINNCYYHFFETDKIKLLELRARIYQMQGALDKVYDELYNIITINNDLPDYMIWYCGLAEILEKEKNIYTCYADCVKIMEDKYGSDAYKNIQYIILLFLAKSENAKYLAEKYIMQLSNSESDMIQKEFIKNFDRGSYIEEFKRSVMK